jgi:hypothetical protein
METGISLRVEISFLGSLPLASTSQLWSTMLLAMDKFKTRFRVNQPQQHGALATPMLYPTNPCAQFTFAGFNVAPSGPPAGSFEYDRVSDKYHLSWDNWRAFEAWRTEEEHSKFIELRLVNTFYGLLEFER